ncbi:primosomal protein N' [Thiohalomonas denitrificans]|uniref:Replication restart protein PriA n=1 Tax=Thiohalomonas denitrificans TaxID=415747 RepID=A0A1G5R0N4_9GAMM|nr:primosomal protein N' [Thiohalomonas denitrificans]SCZ67051.1 replication restart DNA helicase PriA [Thiohalomonas denitrificans]
MPEPVLRIAVPSPLRRVFDYLPPGGAALETIIPGQRVRVPFGKRQVVGVLVEVVDHTDVPAGRLKRVTECLDREPLWSDTERRLLDWAVDYYHHPPGEVYQTALPVLLRQGRVAHATGIQRYRASEAGLAQAEGEPRRAPKQAALLDRLRKTPEGLTAEALTAEFDTWRPALARLQERGWVESLEGPCLPAPQADPEGERPLLNPPQEAAIAAVADHGEGFGAFLVDGVTGSGKTEVYLGMIERTLAAGRQALVLVPEIGLTPQLIDRFRRRFPVPIAVLHSGLSDGERLCAWLAARDGNAPVVIGTRSAVFTPMADLGIIVVDEEHDPSFKQQDGFRYSGRDVAVMRARLSNVPVVLGSATPSVESLHNAQQGRYRPLVLPERAGTALHPDLHLIDIRHNPLTDGLSEPLLKAAERHIAADGQVLIFLNRRGYSPTLFCRGCRWQSSCERCDARMVYYAGARRLRCHHCGADRPLPTECPECASVDLAPVGQGTERVEESLRGRFPEVGLVRIDRDSTRRKGAMGDLLDEVRGGRARILVGTQMLAKGHHFPEVTLVGIVGADQGLFSADFRAAERMAQLIIQVAGRAGRAERPGEVLIQTEFPEHPLLSGLVEHDYGHLARGLLDERRDTGWPPFSHLALLRAEAVDRDAPLAFLEEARRLAVDFGLPGVEIWDPVPAPMEKRAGRVRAQLLLQSDQRSTLHRLLAGWTPQLEGLKTGRRVRWSLDVDPGEMF